MLATYVTDTLTPLSFGDAAGALGGALGAMVGATPRVDVLALALAKTTLECGRDSQRGLLWTSAHRFCIGNIKAGPNYAGMYSAYKCNEVLDGRVVWFSPSGRLSARDGVVIAEHYGVPPGHPQCRFRAYAGPTDGAYQYVDFVASGRYVDAWSELLEGDAEGYVRALHRKGYFTADPDVYARGVVSLQREFVARLSDRPATVEPQPDAETIRSMLASQEWNLREVRALATEAAVDSRFANLESLRRDAHREMAGLEGDDELGDEEPTRPDLPSTVNPPKGNV